MHHLRSISLLLLLAATSVAHAQERRRAPGTDGGAQTGPGIPRDLKMPYAGLWAGTRTMPMGEDPISTRITVNDGTYAGVMILPNGATPPWQRLTATSSGLTWESPNIGGGTWVYSVHLASPDSMVGTLILRDAPPRFNPVPKGTIVLKRQASK
jgi:hypothetical protein